MNRAMKFVRNTFHHVFFLIALAALTPACSIRQIAVNKIGDALASNNSTFESDEDIELVAGALPFSLKLVEGLLAESPKHKGLLLVASQGFTSYSYLEVQPKADAAAVSDFDAATRLRGRMRRLYLRGHNYGMTALELAHPGIAAQLVRDSRKAVAVLKKQDVPLVYWTAAGLGLAISSSRDDVEMIARLPEVEALIDRALELDPAWRDGALHEFRIVLAAAKPGELDVARIQGHYNKALELSKGRSAALHVTLAEALAVQQQDRAEFTRLLELALAVDPDTHKDNRLMNLVAQRRARWLLERTDEMILSADIPQQGGRP
jgi:predicted anti-sigma-YlaC factor YlaD